MCVKGNVTMLPVTLFLYFLAQFDYFYYFCRTKRNNNPKPINPTNSNVMIIKYLQGQPTSASSVNAMCGACRPSCNPFRNDCLPFFLRYAEGVKGVGSIMDSDLQRSRRRATIVSKANISKWVIWVSYAFLLIDIEI